MVDEVNPEFIKWLAQATQCEVKHATLIQPLWSEQGACFRATLSPVGTSATKRVVAKCAQPRLGSHHPRGWSGNTSFQRKCRSFKVEAYFLHSPSTLHNARLQNPKDHCASPLACRAKPRGTTLKRHAYCDGGSCKSWL